MWKSAYVGVYQLNATTNMRSVARGRMINRLKRDSTVLLNQTVWRQTEVCISISTVASLGVHKITTFFRETSSQDVYWVEPVEACEHRDKHFYFTVFFCVLWNCSALLQIIPIYITLRLVMTYLNVIAGIQTDHRPSSYCRLMPVGILYHYIGSPAPGSPPLLRGTPAS